MRHDDALHAMGRTSLPDRKASELFISVGSIFSVVAATCMHCARFLIMSFNDV